MKWIWQQVSLGSVILHGYVDGVLLAVVRRDPNNGYTVTTKGEEHKTNSVRNAKRTAERIVRAKLKVAA